MKGGGIPDTDTQQINTNNLRIIIASSSSSQPDLLACKLEPDYSHEFFLEQLPRVAIEKVAQLAVVVHFAPAITTPLATCHVDDEISVVFIVVYPRVIAVFRTSSRRKAVNLPLRDERGMRSDPWLIDIEKFQSVLFLVFPFHVLLLIADRVPPNIEKAIGPSTSPDEKGPEIESGTILRYY
jgi:hypothetical protein